MSTPIFWQTTLPIAFLICSACQQPKDGPSPNQRSEPSAPEHEDRPAVKTTRSDVAWRNGAAEENLVQYVNPMIGTHGEGNVYPGPAAPFGMVQLSPDTDKKKWATASGYEYSDDVILGFSLQHLSGTGIPDLGDFLFIPSTGEVETRPGEVGKKDHKGQSFYAYDPDLGYATRYSHENEEAAAGYYSVWLPEYNIRVELAATERAGMLKFTFPKSEEANITMDLSHVLQWDVIWSNVRFESDTLITGYHLVSGWARERHLYFAARYSRPFDEFRIIKNGRNSYDNPNRFSSAYEAAHPDLQFYTRYRTEDNEVILVKVGISATSTQGALKNLDAEIDHWDFDRVVSETQKKWNRELQRMTMRGTKERKQTFYTSLYHTFLTPTLYEDVDGKYRGLDQNLRHSEGFDNYAIFSLWDTYRATHPLFTLIQPKRNAHMINSMLAHYDQSVEHLLPIWSLNNNDNFCMIGYHAVSVIADAYMKGLPDIDYERAYEAAKTTATTPNYNSVQIYDELGYMPVGKENESVSKTLEYAYDDFCIAQMADGMGKTADKERFLKRALSYKNLYDSAMGWMRPKDRQGNWQASFEPDGWSREITEGTSYQYSWYVPHDIQGLINLMGGDEAVSAKLDLVFGTGENIRDKQLTEENPDRDFAHYWHGNEPSHHIAYLYNYIGKPWRTQELIHRIMRTKYGIEPNSLSGNDDCGQMSAWYLFNCLGFYPTAPSSNIYVIGSPYEEYVTIKLENGKEFVSRAINLSSENVYIQSVELNGEPWNNTYIPFEAVGNGGEIVFQMGDKPNKMWGTGKNSAPPSISPAE